MGVETTVGQREEFRALLRMEHRAPSVEFGGGDPTKTLWDAQIYPFANTLGWQILCSFELAKADYHVKTKAQNLLHSGTETKPQFVTVQQFGCHNEPRLDYKTS